MNGTTIFLTFTILFAGCTHAPTFEREDRGGAPEPEVILSPRIPVAVVATKRTPAVLRRAIEHTLETKRSVRLVGDVFDALYVVRLDVERTAEASPANIFLCWPGYLAFAPAWHGLEWSYSLRSEVAIDRILGGRVDEYVLDARWAARYTPEVYGQPALLGWCAPPLGLPALGAGIASLVRAPDAAPLDDAFVRSDGPGWARELVATVLTRIAIDRGAVAHR